MTIVLENATSRATINKLGAELSSFQMKDTAIEYIWNGDKEYWARHSPVLFPIVGRLKNNQYTYKGNTYDMPQHGFARDQVFEVASQSDTSVSVKLSSQEDTKKMYPFDFDLVITYTLVQSKLEIAYEVVCHSEEMYFSIGGHPAFNVPLVEGTNYKDYFVSFSPSKSRLRFPLVGPFIDYENRTLAQTNTSIQVDRDWFERDAVVLETKGESAFSIRSECHSHGVTLSYNDFPYVGFWSLYDKEAPFLCIEPWHGVADTLDSNGDITEKLGIRKLTKGNVFQTAFNIEIF